MGTNLLVISVGSLFLIWVIDMFTLWYAGFLKRWMPHFKLRVLLGQLVWALLAVGFWMSLAREQVFDMISPTYFFFVLFIYSVRGLVDSFIKNRGEKSIYQ